MLLLSASLIRFRGPGEIIAPEPLLGSFSREDYFDCLEEDPDVFVDRPFPDVLEVERDDLVEVYDVGPSADLPEAGDPGFHGQPGDVLSIIALIFVEGRRSCAHQAHVPSQHVVELRQLVTISQLLF